MVSLQLLRCSVYIVSLNDWTLLVPRVNAKIEKDQNLSEDEYPSTSLDTFRVEIHHFLHSLIYDSWCITKCQYIQYSLQAATSLVQLVSGLPSTNLF
jgi:hypothetical protein